MRFNFSLTIGWMELVLRKFFSNVAMLTTSSNGTNPPAKMKFLDERPSLLPYQSATVDRNWGKRRNPSLKRLDSCSHQQFLFFLPKLTFCLLRRIFQTERHGVCYGTLSVAKTSSILRIRYSAVTSRQQSYLWESQILTGMRLTSKCKNSCQNVKSSKKWRNNPVDYGTFQINKTLKYE
jgi:hypothetical protein